MSINKLIKEASARGVTRMVLTDVNNSTGVMEFIRKCRKSESIIPLCGIEFRRDKKLLYICISRNREGMRELNEFLTEHNLEKKVLPDQPPLFRHAFVVYPFGHEGTLAPNDFLGIRADELHLLYNKDITDIKNKLLVLQPVVCIRPH